MEALLDESSDEDSEGGQPAKRVRKSQGPAKMGSKAKGPKPKETPEASRKAAAKATPAKAKKAAKRTPDKKVSGCGGARDVGGQLMGGWAMIPLVVLPPKEAGISEGGNQRGGGTIGRAETFW